MDLTISIVNWNTKNILRNCLSSIYRSMQNNSLEIEVIVVDNGSTDESAAMVKSEFMQARLIANTENLGFSRANNQALAISSGRYFLLLNSDTLIKDDSLARMVDFLDLHPEVGVVGPRIVNPDGELQLSGAYFPTLSTAFWGGVWLHRLWHNIFPNDNFKTKSSLLPEEHNGIHEVDWVLGACLATRREALAAIGGMDDGIFFYYEETDLCFRLKQVGWKVFFFGEAEIIHLEGQSYVGAWNQEVQITRQLASLEYFYRKHYRRYYAITFHFFTVGGSLLKMAVGTLLPATRFGRSKFLRHWFIVKWYVLRLLAPKRLSR